MAQFINTNIGALNAQRNLNRSQIAGQTAMQRLSSGLRINSAKDDAAGLAISERMTTQISGLNQAVRNSNDGISLAQTGEGALAEINNNLQRIRELAVQAANTTNSTGDRAALDLEVQQRMAEIDRTASQTSFNGQKILNGTFGNAGFQVGANVGETINLSLSTDMRLTAIGGIASTTSGVLGAAAINGHIDVTSSVLNYGTAGTALTSGNISFTPTTFDFSASALVAGTSTPLTVGVFAFGTAAAAQVDGKAVVGGAGITDFDYSGAGGLAQFDVTIGANTASITLSSNYGSGAALATAIQTQLQATTGMSAVTASFAGGSLTITNAGSTTAVTLSNQDANASAAGSDFDVVTSTAGTAAVATTNATFTVDGTSITLNTNDVNIGGVATEMTTKMQASALGANYSAAVVSGNIVITHAGSTSAVAITGADANAVTAGVVNSAGVAGTAATANNAALTIGATAVSLTANYGSLADLTTAIGIQMGASYNVTSSGGAITVARDSTGAASTAVNITLADANAQTELGLAGASVSGTAGTNLVATTNGTFSVDGTAVTLNQNYADQDAVAAAIQTQLTGYTATNTVGVITIAKTGSLAAVNITAPNANAIAGGFVAASGVAGTSSGTITLATGEFTVAAGADTAVDMVGTYTSAQKLADAINSKASNISATVSGGALTLSSSSALTLGGGKALSGSASANFLSFTANAVATTGDISTANTLTITASNTMIQRVDSALSSVSTLRSTFGAIQNRFESVIASLSTASENASAARSRIRDTDFAAETAELSRTQILQQAGTAMLAQANQSSQGVLSLLR